MNFAKALLQRMGLFPSTGSDAVDKAYQSRLERLCANENKRSTRTGFRPQPSHREA